MGEDYSKENWFNIFLLLQSSRSESLMSAMKKPSAFKPFVLLLAMFSLQLACGGFAVVFYAVNVFQVPAFFIIHSFT